MLHSLVFFTTMSKHCTMLNTKALSMWNIQVHYLPYNTLLWTMRRNLTLKWCQTWLKISCSEVHKYCVRSAFMYFNNNHTPEYKILFPFCSYQYVAQPSSLQESQWFMNGNFVCSMIWQKAAIARQEQSMGQLWVSLAQFVDSMRPNYSLFELLNPPLRSKSFVCCAVHKIDNSCSYKSSTT